MAQQTICEAVALFPSANQLHTAIAQLRARGFERSQLRVMAMRSTVDLSLAQIHDHVEEVTDDPKARQVIDAASGPAIESKHHMTAGLAYVAAIAAVAGAFAATGSFLVAVIAAMIGGGTGGVIGRLVSSLWSKQRTRQQEEQLNRSAALLWVRTRDGEAEKKACSILARSGGVNVHVHSIIA